MEEQIVIAHVYRDLIAQKERIVTAMAVIVIAILAQIIVIAVREIVIAVKAIAIVIRLRFVLECQRQQTKVRCSLEKIMRSKFLCVTSLKAEKSFVVLHDRNHIAIEVSSDVIDMIDHCATPLMPDAKDLDEQKQYQLLTEIHFLHNKVYAESESYDILNNWLGHLKKEIRLFQRQNIKAIYAAGKCEPINEILVEILKIGQELQDELLIFQQPLEILFLTPKEYRSIQIEYCIPADISAFVDSRTLLLINYESYFNKNNTKSFYPTIRHELIHILFGQYAFYLPFWLEEGICEYYSNKYRIDYLNMGLKEGTLISFVQIHSEKVNYISQLSIFQEIQHKFYPQAVSFIDFLFHILTVECVWSITKQSSIRRNFFEVLENRYGISLIQLQEKWESFIKHENTTH